MRPEQLGFKLVQKNLWRRPTDGGYVQLNRKWDDGEEVYIWSIAEFDPSHKRIDRIFDDWAYEDELEQVPQKIIQHNEALLSEEVDMSGDKYLRMLTEDKSSWNVDIDGTPLHVGERIIVVGPVSRKGDKGRIEEVINGFCVVDFGGTSASYQCSDVRLISDMEDIDESTITEATDQKIVDVDVIFSDEYSLKRFLDELDEYHLSVIGPHLTVSSKTANIGGTKAALLKWLKEVHEDGNVDSEEELFEIYPELNESTLTEATLEQSDAFWEISEELNDEVMPDEIEAIWKGSLKGLPLEDIMSDLPAVTNKDVLAVQDKLREKGLLTEALDLTTVDFSKDVAALKKYFAATPERRDGFKFDPNSGVAVVKTEEQHANFPQEVKNAIRNLVTKGVDVRFSMFESKKKLREAKEDIEFKTDEKVFTVKIEKTSVGSFFFTADTRNAGEAVGRVLRDESVEFVPYKKNGKFELHLNVQDFNRDQDVRKLITKLKKRATEWLIAIESGENIKKVADEAESIGNPGDIKKSLDSAVKSTKVKIDFVWPEGTVKPKPDMEEDEAPASDEKEKIDDLKDELKESSGKKKSKTLKEADYGESFVVIEPIVDLMKGIEEKAKKHGVIFDTMEGDQSSKWKVFGKVAALESFLMDALSKSREEARQMIMDKGALHESMDPEFDREDRDFRQGVKEWILDMTMNYFQTEFGMSDMFEEFGDEAEYAVKVMLEEGWVTETTSTSSPERTFSWAADDTDPQEEIDESTPPEGDEPPRKKNPYEKPRGGASVVSEKVEIKLNGPQGNAYALLGLAKNYGKQLGWSDEEITALKTRMKSGDYANLVNEFEKAFEDVLTVIREEKACSIEEACEPESLEEARQNGMVRVRSKISGEKVWVDKDRWYEWEGTSHNIWGQKELDDDAGWNFSADDLEEIELNEDASDIGAPTAEDVKKAKQATGI